MKHHLPRWLPILILLLLLGTFMTGTLQAFASTHSVLDPTATPDASLLATPTPETEIPAYAIGNTNGILSLALVVAAIVIIGAVWGLRKPRTPSP